MVESQGKYRGELAKSGGERGTTTSLIQARFKSVALSAPNRLESSDGSSEHIVIDPPLTASSLGSFWSSVQTR